MPHPKSIWTGRDHCKSRGGSFEAASAEDIYAMKPKNFSHSSTVADSEPDWGGVDKTSLPRQAFADQGEEDKKSSWRYPHHWVKDGGDKDENGIYTTGTMYLHRGGLNAAWSSANGGRSGEEATQAIKDHLNAHRKTLGLEDKLGSRGYSMRGLAGDEADIWLYEEIGEGWFGGISAKRFAKDIQELGDKIQKINLHLNSPGGDVFDGNAIYNILKQHKARVIVSIESLAASIASVIAMAGDEIHMADNALMMIHSAWGLAVGNAEEMRKTAELLDKVDSSIVSTYVKRTGMEEQRIRTLMAEETWMNAEEALGYGFIDKITDALEVAAHFDLSKYRYRNAPKPIALPVNTGQQGRLAHMSLAAQKIRIASNPRK